MMTIVWFRQDLRLADNPALAHAAKRGRIVPVFILDDAEGDHAPRALGGASRWWLHHSLTALRENLGGLVLLRGEARACLDDLVARTSAEAIVWNRCYEPHAISRDKAIKAEFSERGLEVSSFNGGLLAEPWEVATNSGTPFKVYSPFWRALQRVQISAPQKKPKFEIEPVSRVGDALGDWGLLPSKPDWAKGWDKLWQPGEAGAVKRLQSFLDGDLEGYGEKRNRPDLPNVSRLSPHLHFGEISPRQIWARVRMLAEREPKFEKDAAKFLAELGWREFSHHLLYHYPTLPERNWRHAFDAYPWRRNKTDLTAWQKGLTGYPFVDAGLRELWHTGYMHNRVRMVVASFLIKHLRIDWREGAAWFWDTLVDADLANNSASWQWVAGSGADAAPYFRIFNPITQGRKFDPDGVYVRRWCPEIANLDDRYLHAPFEAPDSVLAAAGITLGKTYPKPIVDHAQARLRALEGYRAVKDAHADVT